MAGPFHHVHLDRHDPVREQAAHNGKVLIVAGLLVIALFSAFAIVVAVQGGGLSPVVIGAVFGLLMIGMGLVRWFVGPSALDYPGGFHPDQRGG
ncbi:hypothetical protein ACQ3I4_00240 [Zafaria sp. Z1313]|uniref:hypothetical protein n=1 Tax=Zafaria sp. Z1313 TaxID=3423202 RepID=UPI003D302F78